MLVAALSIAVLALDTVPSSNGNHDGLFYQDRLTTIAAHAPDTVPSTGLRRDGLFSAPQAEPTQNRSLLPATERTWRASAGVTVLRAQRVTDPATQAPDDHRLVVQVSEGEPIADRPRSADAIVIEFQ